MAATTVVTATGSADVPSPSSATVQRRRLWRAVGWLAIAHVVLVFAGAALTDSQQLGDPASVSMATFVASPLARNMAGGYLSDLAFLILLVTGLLLAQLLRGADELGAWLSSCIAGSVVAWVAVIVGAGLAAGAAAMYDGHHGADVSAVTMVSDIRNFAFLLSAGLMGVFLIGVAAAGRRSGLLPRSLAICAAVLGAVAVLSVPAACVGVPVVTTMAWFVWFVAFGISAVRRAGRR